MSSALEDLRQRFPRVAVVHEWLTIPGGSEQVVLEMLDMFPEAELFTSIYDPAPWPPEITERSVHASFLNRMPGAISHYRRLLPLMNRAYRSFDMSRFDLVLSSNHACAKNVQTPPGTLHVCYCHTPMRYAWEPDFLAEEEVGALVKLGLPALMWHLRRQDRKAAAGPDAFVANSKHVARRIERFYGRTAEVVNPPVDIRPLLKLQRRPDAAYLVFGRVVPYKRVDLAVAACELTGRRLDVAGDGRAMPAIRALTGDSRQIELLGWVSSARRDELFSTARALLFPGEEDFGIVPIEAQAAGLPVIAYGVGGAEETVRDGRTGVLFADQTPQAMAAAIERFETMSFDPEEARRHAAGYGRERFQEEMAGAITRAAEAVAA